MEQSVVVRHAFLLLCLGGFAFVMEDQLRTFINQDTSTAMKYRSVGSPPLFDMVTVVFCPQLPDVAVNPMDVGASDYNRSVPRIRAQFDYSGFSQYHLKETQPEVIQEELYTVYNGVCQVFTTRDKVMPQEKLTFRYVMCKQE